MRKILSLLFISATLFSFAQKKKYPVRDTGIKIQTNKKPKLFNISGNVTQTSSYCGGVQPSPEQKWDLATPKPYAGKKFFIKKGYINDPKEKIILNFTTNEKGEFNFKIAPGVYTILLEPQMKALKISDYEEKDRVITDHECLKKWWSSPYYLLTVTDKDVAGLKFEFHHPCFLPDDVPCLTYIGPMPP